MVFSSITFLFYFLPILFLCYFISPRQVKTWLLLGASLFFYAWGEPYYILLMLLIILSGYLLGLLIEHFSDKADCEGLSHDTPLHKKHRILCDRILVRIFFVLSILLPLSFLAYFKYADFILQTIHQIFHISIPLPNNRLPIGISFYTFQVLSYTIDVYRGDVRAQKDPIRLACYISMFPQLIAGPIVRYADIEPQLGHYQFDRLRTEEGVRRFLLGLSKKVLLADRFGELVVLTQTSSFPSVLMSWMYAIAFTLQIYFDFSGYSDMAIGLGKILGFSFPENFQYPYISGSITEFWRRWHISLGSWFRDYVYIPMGGNRVGIIRQLFNIIVVWALTGLWHGASWNFVLWGLLYAILLLIEKLGFLKWLKQKKVVNHLYVCLFVTLGFVLFNADSLSSAINDYHSMFFLNGLPLITSETLYFCKSFAILFLLGILGSTPLPHLLYNRLSKRTVVRRILTIAEPVVLTLLLLLVTAYLVDGSFQPFLYFRF